MTQFILLISLFATPLFAIADIDEACLAYEKGKHVEYNSVITLKGYLRLNAMLENQNPELVKEFAEISMVLETAKPLIIQGGEINNPVACSVSDFTLYLSPENLKIAQEAMSAGRLVEVTGNVGAAESSIEEYDNAILRKIVSLKIL